MFYIDEEDGVGVYPGYDDSKADIAGRIAVMERAIEASLEAPDLDTSNDTLKIFLAPEFFFRGPVGAYSADDPALLELGDSLRSMVANTKWQDWVFVFGSIIGSNKMAPEKKTNLTGGPLWDTYNFAIVQRGNSPERHTHFKRYISGIDFLVSVPDHPGALLSDARSCHARQPAQPPPSQMCGDPSSSLRTCRGGNNGGSLGDIESCRRHRLSEHESQLTRSQHDGDHR